MRNDIKVYVVGGDRACANWISNNFVETVKEADLVLFTGGEDIDPSLYGHPKHNMTHSNLNRDHDEAAFFKLALNDKKKILGIGRGAQLICVMAGGNLIQHQENPGFIHTMYTSDNDYPLIRTTSTHHQSQDPHSVLGMSYDILAWTENAVGKKENGYYQAFLTKRDIEIVYYRNIDALAIQGHPEYVADDPNMMLSMSYHYKLLDKFMYNRL